MPWTSGPTPRRRSTQFPARPQSPVTTHPEWTGFAGGANRSHPPDFGRPAPDPCLGVRHSPSEPEKDPAPKNNPGCLNTRHSRALNRLGPPRIVGVRNIGNDEPTHYECADALLYASRLAPSTSGRGHPGWAPGLDSVRPRLSRAKHPRCTVGPTERSRTARGYLRSVPSRNRMYPVHGAGKLRLPLADHYVRARSTSRAPEASNLRHARSGSGNRRVITPRRSGRGVSGRGVSARHATTSGERVGIGSRPRRAG